MRWIFVPHPAPGHKFSAIDYTRVMRNAKMPKSLEWYQSIYKRWHQSMVLESFRVTLPPTKPCKRYLKYSKETRQSWLCLMVRLMSQDFMRLISICKHNSCMLLLYSQQGCLKRMGTFALNFSKAVISAIYM